MSAGPQLSSVATALTEMTERVTQIADQLAGTERDDLAVVLFEVERSLNTACRRLDKVVAELT
jgi:DNA/RNA-binding domain of Phe-tRNA-synthetase-like protein